MVRRRLTVPAQPEIRIWWTSGSFDGGRVMRFCGNAALSLWAHPDSREADRRTIASRRGCRISPPRRPFVVALSNDRAAAHGDSACGRGVGVASATLVGDLSNALDLCDSHRRMRKRAVTENAVRLVRAPTMCPCKTPGRRGAWRRGCSSSQTEREMAAGSGGRLDARADRCPATGTSWAICLSPGRRVRVHR